MLAAVFTVVNWVSSFVATTIGISFDTKIKQNKILIIVNVLFEGQNEYIQNHSCYCIDLTCFKVFPTKSDLLSNLATDKETLPSFSPLGQFAPSL